MCKFKSAIVLRNGDILHNDFTDSHEDLIELFGLVDNGKENFVRIEYSTNSKRLDKIENYSLVVDEKSTPAWFEEIREPVAEQMKTIVLNMIISENLKIIVGRSVILTGNAIVNKIRHCIIHEMRGSSQVGTMRESSQVGTMLESSQVGEMWGSSQVGEMRESSQVGKMWGSSQVGEMLESSQVGTMWESSQVGKMWGSSQVGEMWGSSQVGEMRESSQVGKMWGSSQVGEMWGSSQVGEMRESSQVKTDKRIKK